MDDLKIGQIYYVTAETSDNVDLRREPTMNSKTEDGQDNVIISLPLGAEVTLESREVRAVEGHNWYNIRYIQDDVAIIGWVVSDYLLLTEAGYLIPVTGGCEVTDVDYKGIRKFDIAYMPSDPGSLPQGLVKYKSGGKTIYTSLDDWNAVGGARYKLS